MYIYMVYIYIYYRLFPIYTSPSSDTLLGEKAPMPFGVLHLKMHRFSKGL